MNEALEDFKELKKTTCFYCQYHINEECVNNECIWINVEKSLKALEIIKNNDIIATLDFIQRIAQNKEQYDFLKEVLL